MELNNDQQIAYDALVAYIMEENHEDNLCVPKIFDEPEHSKDDIKVLEGYAGTGKSFIINRVVEFCMSNKQSFLKFGMTATTHKAVKVLKKASKYPDMFDFGTIHSFCGLIQVINDRTGEVTYEPDKNPGRELPIEAIDVLICDEVSMLNTPLHTILLNFQKRLGFKIIFVGDPEQLPPIKERLAVPFIPILQKKYNMGVNKLFQIVRQAEGNPIIDYATNIRTKTGIAAVTNLMENGDGVEVLPMDENLYKKTLEKYFKSKNFELDSDYAKVLAYENRVVDAANKLIREIVYGSSVLPMILKGESLIADKPIMVKTPIRNEMKIIMNTNEEFVVLDVSKESKQVSYRVGELKEEVFETESDFLQSYDRLSVYNKSVGQMHDFTTPLKMKVLAAVDKSESFSVYKCHVLYTNFKGEDATATIDILAEDSISKFQTILNSIKDYALKLEPKNRGQVWRTFYGLQNNFAFVKYNYAVTVHKSQGSTYNYVFVHEWNLESNRDPDERRKLKYVAATRAKNKLYIINQ